MCATLPDPEIFSGAPDADADADGQNGDDEGAPRLIEPRLFAVLTH